MHDNKIQYYLFISLIILGGITFGYNISVIASALPQIKNVFAAPEKTISLIAGLVFLGTMLAKLSLSFFTDYFGRRKTLLIASIIFILGSLSIVMATSITYILYGRILQGIGGGLLMFTTSLYIIELANDKTRGRLTALYQLSFTVGLLLANLVGLWTFNINWHLPFLFLIALTIFFIIIVLYLPCSPGWLFRQGKLEQAKKALMIDHTADEVAITIHAWKNSGQITKAANIFQTKYLKALGLVITVTCLNQLTGINAILQTSTMLIHQSGLASNHAALIGSVGITAINVVATLIGIKIIDLFPRNLLLGYCALIITCAHIILAINFFANISSSVLLLGGLFLFIAAYAIGPGIIIWLVFSEYLPLPVRSQAISIAGFINALAGFLISSMFLHISHIYGSGWVFLSCAIFSLLFALIPMLYLPDTNGKDIENFEELFSKK